MLTVTNDATQALRAALAHGGSGIRITARSVRVSGTSGRPRLELEAATRREPGDEVLHLPGGPALFLAPVVVPLLTDKVLDGTVDEEGNPRFIISDGPRAAPLAS